jgi:hypothetical protein
MNTAIAVGRGVHHLALVLLNDVLGVALDDDRVIGQFLERLAGIHEQHADAALDVDASVAKVAPETP